MTHPPAAQPILVTVDDISLAADDTRLASLVTDDGRRVTVPLDLLPDGAREGDVLLLTVARDDDERDRRARRVSELQRDLFG